MIIKLFKYENYEIKGSKNIKGKIKEINVKLKNPMK